MTSQATTCSSAAGMRGAALLSSLAVLLLLCLLASDAAAAPRRGELVSSLAELFPRQAAPGLILAAARRLFWMLATISLVWNFGVLLLRRADLGEVFLELLRFVLFTGLFYWLLIGASTADGFVYAIFDSFKLMSGVGNVTAQGDDIVQLGLRIFYRILEQSQNWKEADVLVASALSIATIAALTLLAAQIVLIVVMAWMLAYAGIFLLGMGGARWTSPVAIGFYRHVLALGSALLVLALLIKLGQAFIQGQAWRVLAEGGDAKGLDYVSLAEMFVVALLMSVLGIRLPGLIYTLVTGSPLGLLAGTAGMTASAVATGGGHLYATAASAFYPGPREYRGAHDPASASRGSMGGSMATQAIHRAAGLAQTQESVFEPFGQRPQAAAGTVFSQASGASGWIDARTAAHAQASAERFGVASAPGQRASSSPTSGVEVPIGSGPGRPAMQAVASGTGTVALHGRSDPASQPQAVDTARLALASIQQGRSPATPEAALIHPASEAADEAEAATGARTPRTGNPVAEPAGEHADGIGPHTAATASPGSPSSLVVDSAGRISAARDAGTDAGIIGAIGVQAPSSAFAQAGTGFDDRPFPPAHASPDEDEIAAFRDRRRDEGGA